MRLAGLLMVPMASVAISVVGVYVAAPAGADCEARNGTMLCTDAPAPGQSGPPTTTSYPCIVGLTCQGTFESDLVTGNGPDNVPSPPRPRPPRPNPGN